VPNSNFPKRLRLLRPPEFDRVFSARTSASNAWLILYAASNDLGHPRLGLTVSRKIGGAVERNRWKRLLREAFRLSQHQLPTLDFVCVARSPAPPTLTELKQSIAELAVRLERKLRRTVNQTEPESP
jgi:ribonuclease P protein component